MSENKLIALLDKGVVIGDGAMGTMIYDKGIFLNSCFDELNLSRADLIKNIHKAYVEAGVDFIETNTFGANEIKLARFGLAEKTQQINTAAVEIARQCAGDSTLVAGSMGPLSSESTAYTDQSRKLAHKAFQNQASALVKAGVDFLILETFSSSEELLIAIAAVREITDLPVIAQMTVNQDNLTIYGERIESAIVKISAQDVTAVGLNCSVGPADMLGSLELISKLTDKPISVQPNAGLPRQVEHRTLYMCTPEYMAEYAKKFFEKGAKIIGGCCGTTPEHIAQIVRAVKALDKAQVSKKTISIVVEEKKHPAPEVAQLSLEQKSKIGAKLAAGEKITTIEITPPRGIDMSAIIEKACLCDEMGIDAINIPDGPRASSRLSPVITAALIQQQTEIETIVHFCCRDRNLIGMQSDILGAGAIGLNNMLIITGDPPKLGQYPDATGVFDVDSIALTSVLKNLNCGIDIGGNGFS
ncbi:MAG: bifunctional homocysteine S-methyltransferase/methylenetetrahydrofolate reductase, partial [Planctomycetes bacterium]|nr:bifunctional homocysteine S-methyltransferase/methylenetetrahydrofolate reductase [Planctomycetota bacterium]